MVVAMNGSLPEVNFPRPQDQEQSLIDHMRPGKICHILYGRENRCLSPPILSI